MEKKTFQVHMANESAQLGGISVKWDENFPYECKFAMLQPG